MRPNAAGGQVRNIAVRSSFDVENNGLVRDAVLLDVWAP